MHVPQLGGLLVGFNFGAWQLFNLSTLKLEFSPAYEGSETASFTLPVTGFAFCEPVTGILHQPTNYKYTVSSLASGKVVQKTAQNFPFKIKSFIETICIAAKNGHDDRFFLKLLRGNTL